MSSITFTCHSCLFYNKILLIYLQLLKSTLYFYEILIINYRNSQTFLFFEMERLSMFYADDTKGIENPKDSTGSGNDVCM